MASESEEEKPTQGRFTGCQVAALVGGVLLVAGVCVVLGLVVGGVAGDALGRSTASPAGPPFWGGAPPAHPTLPPRPIPRTPPIPPEERPYLGIRYRLLERGARIEEVEPGSPAAEAGLEPGDLILEVDGTPVGAGDGLPLNVLILAHEPGDQVRLRVEREGEVEEIEVELGRWSDRQP